MRASDLIEQPLHEELVYQVAPRQNSYDAALRMIPNWDISVHTQANMQVGAGPVPEPAGIFVLAAGLGVILKRLRMARARD
ncbi:MAG: hypothetical protein C4341_00635 [Armatimonadota bacterium]